MNLPIRFPDPADVIYEEAARFRALSPAAQAREMNEGIRLYRVLRTDSGQPEKIDRLAEEQERLGREAILEFVARHG